MITAIVLAAGMSTRLGVPKQLLDYLNRPLIRHSVETILSSQVQEVIVVVGSRAGEVSDALKELPVSIVVNDDYVNGQSTSIKKGINSLLEVRDLKEDSLPQGIMFALGDQPLLKPETIDLLIKKFNSYGGIVIPYYKGTRGNPVIFARKFLPEFQALSGDTGARELIKRYQGEVYRVEVEDVGVTFDIDTWEDYEQLTYKE